MRASEASTASLYMKPAAPSFRAGSPAPKNGRLRNMRKMKPVDLRLNAIIDPERAGGHDIVVLARRVVDGGATLVQLRDKRSDTRAMVATARAIKAALAGSGVPFVVNDRVDVALAAAADGVHLGPEDMAVD